MDELADELFEKLNTEDPLQITLNKEENEFGYLGEMTTDFARMLYSGSLMTKVVAVAELGDSEVEKDVVVSTPEDCDVWSKLKASKVELKPLLVRLRYAFLGTNSTYPVIVHAELNNVESACWCRIPNSMFESTRRFTHRPKVNGTVRIGPDKR